MKAIVITRPGGPEVLEEWTVPTPAPQPREVRVRVHATSINRADLLQRRGGYPAPAGWPPDIPGLDYAGVVESLGEDASRFQPGDRVMGLVGGGSYAEYVVVHEDEVVPIPEHMSFEEAAAVPEVFLTAHDALRQLELAGDEWLLIHAVGSGVGTAAVQLAKARGARVAGTARAQWKLDRARELGLDVAVDGSQQEWPEGVRTATGGGVHAIMDLVGGPYIRGDIEVALRRARILVVGLVAGAKSDVDFRQVLNKRLRIQGTVLRSRSLEEKIDVARAFTAEALPLLASGRVGPIIERVLPISSVAEAHAALERNESFGKVVLTW